jgi:acylphosphatase
MSGAGSTVKTVRVAIEGHVQGVGFRAWVERAAAAHALDGWVRNRRDGSVEAVLSGPAAAVDAMVASCRRGPPAATVARVAVREEPAAPPRGFQVMPTV